MTTQYIYDLVDTWNDGATTFTSIKMNVTDTASNAASLLMDLQVGGASQASIDKRGTLSFAAPASGTAPSRPGIGNWFGTLGLFGNSGALAATVGSTVINFGSSYQLSWNADVILTRRGIANLRLGAADTTGTTAPTPQFLSAQSWSSSTTNNQTGANFTIDGSQGTGTGAGGSIIFRVAPAGGTSNGVQNALATALTINSAGVATFVSNVNASNLVFNASGGGLYVPGGGNFLTLDGSLATTFGGLSIGNGNAKIYGDAANTLALRNSTAAQRFNVYNTYTTSTNYEAFKIDWITTANTVLVGTEKGSGGGTARDLEFQRDGTTQIVLANGETRIGPGASPLITFGQSSASTSARFGFYGGVQLVNSTVSGVTSLRLTNGALGDFGALQFGGTSSSFPALKRSSTTLQARLADDSAFASVQGKLTTDTAYTAGAPTATGYLVVYDSAGTAYRIPAVLN